MKEVHKEDCGGKTRDYLILMLEKDTVYHCLCVLALCYLSIYLPIMTAILNIKHRTELIGICASVVAAFRAWADDPATFLDGSRQLFEGQDESAALTQIRAVVRGNPFFASAAAQKLLASVFDAGGFAYTRHNIEHM